MKTFKKYLCSSGFTLIEILASFTILAIVLTIFFNTFSQSMLFSSKVEEQISAVNIAERILYDVKQAYTSHLIPKLRNIDTGCINESSENIMTLREDRNEKDFYEVNNKAYYPQISICQSVEENGLELYRVHIKIFDDNKDEPQLLSEIFDYINLIGL